MSTIQEYWRKFKQTLDERGGEWLLPIIVILVGFSSFGLGRLSAYEQARPAVRIYEAVESDARPITIGGMVVASRTGNAYHFPWCPGAETMKESNKIWFKDEAVARKAGYAPAKNCEGLK